MSNAAIGHGTTIKYGTTSGAINTAIPEVLDITGPTRQSEDIECTNMDSPSRTREYIPGYIQSGELTFDINYYKSSLATLETLRGTVYYWKVTYPDNSTWVGQGYVADVTNNTPVQTVHTVSVRIKATGSWTFTAA